MMTIVIAFGLAGVAVLVCAFFLYFILAKIAKIRRTPTYWVSALPSEGAVEVSGKAGPAVTRSPIQQVDCVFWKVEVKTLKRSGKNQHWETLYQGTSSQLFTVADETGQVLIDPYRAELDLAQDLQKSSGVFNGLDLQTEQALQKIGVQTSGFMGMQKTLRISETYIEPGEEIFVLGELSALNGQKVIKDSNQARMVITDQSESSLLRDLYMQAGIAVVGGLVALAAIVIVYLNGAK